MKNDEILQKIKELEEVNKNIREKYKGIGYGHDINYQYNEGKISGLKEAISLKGEAERKRFEEMIEFRKMTFPFLYGDWDNEDLNMVRKESFEKWFKELLSKLEDDEVKE